MGMFEEASLGLETEIEQIGKELTRFYKHGDLKELWKYRDDMNLQNFRGRSIEDQVLHAAWADNTIKELDLFEDNFSSQFNEPEKDPCVTFAIPMISRYKSKDWRLTQILLNGTLRTIRNQSNPNWQVIICSQDKPYLPKDPRIHFTKFDPSLPDANLENVFVKGFDKRQKISQIYRIFETHLKKDGYIFHLDADDLLHPNLVQRVVETRSKGLVLCLQGYMLSATSNLVMQEGSTKTEFMNGTPGFYRRCGSSLAVRIPIHVNGAIDHLQKCISNHGLPFYRYALHGFEFKTIDEPLIAYLVHHDLGVAENLSSQRQERLEAGHVGDHEALKIINEFGIVDHLSKLSKSLRRNRSPIIRRLKKIF